MSASREKKERKNEILEPKKASEQKKGMSSKLKTAIIIAAIVVFVALVVFFTMLSGGFFASHSTAATTGSHNVTPAMVNYFFADVQNTTQQTYGDLYSYMIDSEKPLSEQMYNEEEGTTWADFFNEQALTKISQTYAIYDDAVANGFALTEEDHQQIDSYLSSFETYAGYYGFSNADGYIAASYGSGCNAKNFREYMELTLLVSNYCASKQDELTYSAEDIAAAYAEAPNDYDKVTYRKFSLSFSDLLETEDAEVTDEIKAQVKDIAETMAAECNGKDADSFNAACISNAAENTKSYYEEDADYSLRADVAYAACESQAADWLFDARTEGDTAAFETETGYIVVFFVSRSTNDMNLVNVRHILVSVNEGATEDEKAAAKTTAEDILAEYMAGEQTEEAFAELAKTNSADGSAAEGGLYEDVYPGQMVTAFNDWCFDASRQTGDVDIVETEYGYHVIYFVGQSETVYRDFLVENTLKTADYTAWEEGLTADASYTVNEKGLALCASH